MNQEKGEEKDREAIKVSQGGEPQDVRASLKVSPEKESESERSKKRKREAEREARSKRGERGRQGEREWNLSSLSLDHGLEPNAERKQGMKRVERQARREAGKEGGIEEGEESQGWEPGGRGTK